MDCCDEQQRVSDAKMFDQGSVGGMILIGRKGKHTPYSQEGRGK